jgi:hypothetical protein
MTEVSKFPTFLLSKLLLPDGEGLMFLVKSISC